MEEFEDKVDKIAIGEDNNSWIGQLYQQFSSNFGIDGSKLDDDDIGDKEGLELMRYFIIHIFCKYIKFVIS